jgi:fermentation-respiration switch protein FrsA (DUF1100 family)
MKLLLVFLGLYLVYAGFFFLMQRRMMYPVAYAAEDWYEPRGPGAAQVVKLESLAGSTEAWFLPAPSPGPHPALIFAHGNGEIIDIWAEAMSLFAARGLSVLLVEFPGYARSEGAPTQESIHATFQAGYDWLVSRDDVDADRIVGMGRSLGGGAVTGLSSTRSMAALILTSTFTSIGDLARKNYFLPGFLALDPFDNQAALSSFPGPVLIVHGRRDRQIPFRHGQALAAASPRGRLLSLDCGHNDCPPSWAEFVDDIWAFLQEEGVVAPES